MEIGSNNALNKCPNSAGRRGPGRGGVSVGSWRFVIESMREGHFINPGLLKGPYLIFYAVAALVLMASVSFIHEYNVFVIKRGA